MGGIFRKKNRDGAGQEGLPAELLQRCRAQPASMDVFREIAGKLKGKPLIDFYRQRAKESDTHLVGLARAYAESDHPALAVVQYRKLLQSTPDSAYGEELAVQYEKLGHFSDAEKTRNQYR